MRKSITVDHLLKALRLPEAFIEKESRMFGEALLPCMSDEGVVHPSVTGYLGSSEIIYGELNLCHFQLCAGLII